MMKRIFNAFLALAMVITAGMTLTSCSVSDNPAVPQDPAEPQDPALADVTIMYYGHGGGNLDLYYIDNLRHLYQAEASSYENVKIAIEYKFSTTDNLPLLDSEEEKQEREERMKIGGKTAEVELYSREYLEWMSPEGSSTLRFVLDPKLTLKEQAEGHYLPGKNADFTNPDSLTNFINWAAKACPAKKYVLILNDHGHGYVPHEEIYNGSAASTRGVIFDDGNARRHFTAPSLAHAVRAAGIRPDVIYFDACLMNSLEYMFELKDVTDYIVASTFITYVSGPYATLIDVLSKTSDHLKYGLEKYTEYYVNYFEGKIKEGEVFYYDMTVTETAMLDQLGKAMREFTDRLCNTYQYGTAEQKQDIDEVTQEAIKITDSNALYDVCRYMEDMCRAMPEVYDAAFVNELSESFNNCIAGQYTSKYLRDRDYQVDYSVLLATKGAYLVTSWMESYTAPETRTLTAMTRYEPDGRYTAYSVENGVFKKDVTPDYTLKAESEGQWGGTLESVYGALAFDKATGWSRWLLLNEQQPSLWCNNEFKTPLPAIEEE